MHPQQTCYPFQLSHGHPLLLHVNKKSPLIRLCQLDTPALQLNADPAPARQQARWQRGAA